MKERPLLMSGPMVRAILDGTKTQTRRVMREQPPATRRGRPWASTEDLLRSCPYGRPGDRLWVRETWKENEPPSGWIYRATDEATLDPRDGRPWRPSIFMPRRASRLTLEVTDVRVQRLQEISEEDARLEGRVPSHASKWPDGDPGTIHDVARRTFSQGWDSINGKRAPWSSNPWVWAITFKRLA